MMHKEVLTAILFKTIIKTIQTITEIRQEFKEKTVLT